MREAGGGSTINLSSIAWIIPAPKLFVYTTAKVGIVGMAHELGEAKIRTRELRAAWGDPYRASRRLWMSDEYEREVLGLQCIKRRILPEAEARLLLFLAADDIEATTNQSHIVDGGRI